MAAYRCVFNAITHGQQLFSLSSQLRALSMHAKCTLLMTSHRSSLSETCSQSSVKSARDNSTSTASFNVTASLTSNDEDYSVPFDSSLVNSLFEDMEGDLPISDMPDPFIKNYRRCFLCKQNVKLNHKNVRLLSQFVSPYTGRIYGRAVTGLCIPMQKHVARLIKRSRKSGYMPFILKDPKYLQDPQPFDPMSQRKIL